jgi:hypothetical protein
VILKSEWAAVAVACPPRQREKEAFMRSKAILGLALGIPLLASLSLSQPVLADVRGYRRAQVSGGTGMPVPGGSVQHAGPGGDLRDGPGDLPGEAGPAGLRL